VVLQVALAQLTPEQVLRPDSRGAFPVSEEEMRWQLSFLAAADRGLRAWMPPRLGG
jgi:hypothetical protein